MSHGERERKREYERVKVGEKREKKRKERQKIESKSLTRHWVRERG